MFTRISKHYDRLNFLMTFGRDRRWRVDTIRKLKLTPGQRVLDVGAGTGDLAFEALHQCGQVDVVACDFTPAMLEYGRKRDQSQRIQWVLADAHALPFAPNTFQAVVSGFLLRNAADLKLALSEQARVLAHSGRVASLDTTPPQQNLLRPLFAFYFRWVIPTLGRLFAGDAAAYRYLPETTEAFLEPSRLQQLFEQSGFQTVRYVRRMLGTIAIHWGLKETNSGESADPGREGARRI